MYKGLPHKILVIIMVALLASGTNQAQKVFVPVAGNTWVINNTQDQIDKTGIKRWQDPQSVLSTYFKLDKPGYVEITILERTAHDTASITFSMIGQSHVVNMNNTKGDTVMVGRFNIAEPGYQALQMQGKSSVAGNFADIRGIWLEGSAIDSQSAFVKDEFYWGRRGPSVHLRYKVPQDVAEVTWFYNEITVPTDEDIIGSYFMANGFAEGYFGIQVNSATERRVLFSVWSPYKTDDPEAIPEEYKIKLLAKGEGVSTAEFGNEGSGGQSYWPYMWQAGNTYRFLLKGEPSENNATDYTAWFYAPEIGKWQLIASFRRPKTTTYLKHLHSFLENFVPDTGYKSRKLYYSNQWVYDTSHQWHELTQATFTADATARKGARLDYLGGSEGERFFLQNCGFFNTKLEIGSILHRVGSGTPPQINFVLLPGH